MAVRIYIVGRVQIESAAGLIDEPRFPGRQGRLLFAYLVRHRQRPVTREELADVLWGESLPVAWEGALHALVSKLRRLLAVAQPDAIGLTHAFGTYLLRLSHDVWVDREAAAEAIDTAEAFLRSGKAGGAWAPANIAAITARRPFLPGDEGPWVRDERGRLHDLLVRALDCLAEVWMANGEHALALATARETVTLEPFRETGYQRLMRFHLAVGNRGEALRAYEECRRQLVEELGTDPSFETQQIYMQLLASP